MNEMFDFLNGFREDGPVNLIKAVKLIENRYGLNYEEARRASILWYASRSFPNK